MSPLFSFTARRQPDPKDIAARCRRIAADPLDVEAVNRSVAAYHSQAKSKNYREAWGARLAQILEVIEAGETDLPRVLALVARKTEEKRAMDLGQGSYVAFDKLVELPSRGAQRLHRGVVTEAVCDLCSRDTKSVIELGSGWGEHLCNVWNEGGPRDATYFALEIAESGRKCALVLAALEPGLKLKAAHFNYVEPDFSAVPRGQKEIVVYSVQSIEQVKEVPKDLITGLCGLADAVKCVHFEPIGWQMIPEGEKNPVTRRHEERCAAKRYNANYWALLRAAEEEGLITILKAVPNFFGLEHNPTSYIVWAKK